MMQIRKFRESDTEAVSALWRSLLSYDAPHNAPQLSIARKMQFQPDLLFVADNGGTAIGTVMAGYDGHRGWLYSVAVHPDHRRQNIGSMLVRHAEQALMNLGCVKINLQILAGNAAVTGFYQALGYAVEERISMGKRVLR